MQISEKLWNGLAVCVTSSKDERRLKKMIKEDPMLSDFTMPNRYYDKDIPAFPAFFFLWKTAKTIMWTYTEEGAMKYCNGIVYM